MPQQRWFGGKAREPRSFRIARHAAFGEAWLLAVEVAYAEGGRDEYLVPLIISESSEKEIARMEDGRSLREATFDASFRDAMFRLMTAGVSRSGVAGWAGTYLKKAFPAVEVPVSRVLSAEQSNTSLIYGDRLFAKLYRKIVPGLNPDTEMTRFLSEVAGFRHVPAFGGSIEWGDAQILLALELRPNDGNAWELALQEFGKHALEAGALEPWEKKAELLGQRTGEFHRALYEVGELPEAWAAFRPEALGGAALERLRAEIGELPARAEAVLEAVAALASVSESVRETLHANGGSTGLPAVWRAALEELQGKDWTQEAVTLMRTHGDYHLGQVLYAQGDFVLIDFEGEPSRTMEERRSKRPPIRDVAGMARSFHYAAHAARGEAGVEAAEEWASASQRAFLRGWRGVVAGSAIADERLLGFYLLEKLVYELQYELNNRPDWVHIPLRGLAAAVVG